MRFKKWLPRLAFRRDERPADTLVVVFLRGGADGMNIVVPHGEDNYYTLRPRLAVPRPDDNKIRKPDRAFDLDGFFGLHPVAAPLAPIFQAGHMSAVHAVGSPDLTRSHFEAMESMERGGINDQTVGNGWLGRHLNTVADRSSSPLRAVGWGAALPLSMYGSINAVSLKSILDYHLPGSKENADAMLAALSALYASAPADLAQSAKQVETVSTIQIASYQPENGATYVDSYGVTTDFDMALMQTAALVKADIGLEVSAIDLGGWDTHENQNGYFRDVLRVLTNGLNYFYTDLGDRINRVTLIVMSEFGRRLKENASIGTDHGHGSMMLTMGGHLSGKPVVADWPGLADDDLDRGDLRVTTDYRDVLGEILATRMGNDKLDQVFPDYTPMFKGVVTG